MLTPSREYIELNLEENGSRSIYYIRGQEVVLYE